ncbi:class I SAM-dependent methyltransferase [Candidatus Acetothermia bacterium]|nr:class I SAM-dependent methyltransferase [Candidatus Acetothermia bacterium]MBI3661038.1 class I SAM-dependent methyltransferase [Candidatus Acetothermia bacterium]
MDPKATAVTKARYNRIAPLYDLMDSFMEWLLFREWRKLVWQAVGPAQRLLEVGVGTGKNILYYPEDTQITAIDLSDQMLMRARKRAQKLGLRVELSQMDAQALDFADDALDTVVATFVFCSVPDPVLGLQEINRVLRPGGKVVLLEHMRPESPWLGRLFDLLNPFVVRLWGANINRRTVENVRLSGLEIENIESLTPQGIVQMIIARAGKEK